MKKLRYATTLSALALIFTSAFSTAATVEFSWDDPAKFQDIKETSGNNARFQTRVINELEEQFRKEAEQLPADQTLHVTVHDVDLAGYVEYFHPGYPFGLRVVRNIDFPIIDLSYELKDANNAVIKSGTEEIKDLGFRNATLTNNLQRDPFRYENQLIKEWYDSEFRSEI
jgi:hypothetical protein